MPQSSDELRKLMGQWFGDEISDEGPYKYLMSKGWIEEAGMFYSPTPSYFGPVEDYIVLKFMMEEWDYSWESTSPNREILLRVSA